MSGRLFSLLFRAGVLSLALGATGCDSLNPFKEKEVPLPGARRPLFPPGHANSGPQRTELPPNQTVPTPAVPPPGPAQ